MSKRCKLAQLLLASAMASAVTMSAWAASSTSSQAARQFFRGKSLTIIVPYGPGGGYDTWARLIAPYLKRYLALDRVEVQNQEGGGGVVGTDAIYRATPDGLTIGDTNAAGDVFAQITHSPGVHFDVSRLCWIGRPDNDPQVIAVHPDGPYKSFDDLIALKGGSKVVLSLATGAGSSDYGAETIIYNAFGVPYRIIAAFIGSHAEKATFVSGLGDAVGLSASAIAELGDDNARVILLMARQPFPRLAGVPTVVQEARARHLAQNKVQILTRLANVMTMGHAFIAPPGVPSDRLNLLRAAFRRALHNTRLVRQATKAGLYVGYRPGPQLQQQVRDAMAHSAQFRSFMAVH